MSILRELLSENFTFTKRQLGLLLIIGGVILLVSMFAAEIISADSTGIGTMQQLGIAAGVASSVLGLTLLPLGNRPA